MRRLYRTCQRNEVHTGGEVLPNPITEPFFSLLSHPAAPSAGFLLFDCWLRDETRIVAEFSSTYGEELLRSLNEGKTMYTVTLPGNLTQAESALVKRGTIQIAALLAAKITGRGLIINDGDIEYSWDFILVDASSDEQNTFDERLLRMLSDYIHAGFPDAVVRYTKHEAPKLSK